MNPPWSESWLRSVADWQAVKLGRQWCDAGAVSGLQVEATTVRGRVGEGKSARRVLVRVLGPHEVEARCGCPLNATGGAICGHAAALVLAAAGHTAPAPRQPTQPATVPAAPPATALHVEFPPNWLAALAHGKLAAQVRPLAEAQPCPADHRLAANWLRRTGGRQAIMQLEGEQVARFLADLDGHPRVAVAGRTPAPIEVLAGALRVPARIEPTADGRFIEFHWQPGSRDDQLLMLAGAPWLWCASDRRLGTPAATAPHWQPHHWATLATGQPLPVPPADAWPLIESARDLFEVPAGGWLNRLRFIQPQPELHLSLDGSHTVLSARLSATYPPPAPSSLPIIPVPPDPPPPATVLGWDPARDRVHCRNHRHEQSALRLLLDAGFQPTHPPDHLQLAGTDAIARFVADTLPDCRALCQIHDSPTWHHAHARFHIVRPSLQPTQASRPNHLAFQIQYLNPAGHPIPTQQIQQLLASRHAIRHHRDGTIHALANSMVNRLEQTIETMGGSASGDLREVLEVHAPWLSYLRDNLYNSLATSALGCDHADPDPACIDRFKQVIATCPVPLRDYQRTGVLWLRERLLRWGAALLADDMGLGKTVQVLVVLRGLWMAGGPAGCGPMLVVCPTSVLGHWVEQAGRFWPGCRVALLHGSEREAGFARLDEMDLAVTSYGTLERDRALHLGRRYGAVVIDEASMIRNPSTDVARTVSKLQADLRLALTGTPIENGVGDLWSIFRFLRPGYLGGWEDFMARYQGEGAGPQALAQLRQRVAPLVLRRTKEQVAAELPPRICVDEWCVLSAGQRELYDAILREHQRRSSSRERSEAQERMEILTVLLRLRQVCCDPGLLDAAAGADPAASLGRLGSAKVERCVELVGEALSEGRKVLVFSQFARMLARLRARFAAAGVDSALLCGATTDRNAELARFRRADGPPLFLISLKAGGYGLNLTEADVVIHFDPWWNPAAEAQATDRAHRIGQTKPVNVYRLLTKDSVEAHVLRLQTAKRHIIDATLDEEQLGPAQALDTRELRALLAASARG